MTVAWAVLTAQAGEPIRFSNEKSKPAPDAANRFSRERFSTLERVPTINPFEALSAPRGNINSKGMNPKEEKCLKNAKLEEKNWVLLDRGELQEQDDQETSFGVRDYSGDSLEKDGDRTAEIWFGSNQDRGDKAAGAGRVPGSSTRSSNPGRPQPTARPIDSDIKFGPEKAPSFNIASDSGQASAKDFGFQPVAADRDANHALKELFNLGSAANRTAIDPERGREGFGLRSIDTQPGAASPGMGRSFTLGTDIARPAEKSTLIEGPRIQPGSLGDGLGSRRLSSSFDSSRFDLHNASRSSVTPLAQPRNDYSPASTRDLFAPPPRPGQPGAR
jgi:hypothetical protein